MTPQTKEHLKTAASIAFLALCWPATLYYAALWLANAIEIERERRHGINRQPGDVCARCGMWEAAHNEFVGCYQTGCMRFRLGRAGT